MASRDCAEKTTCTDLSSAACCSPSAVDTYRKLEGKSLHSSELAVAPDAAPVAELGADDTLRENDTDKQKAEISIAQTGGSVAASCANKWRRSALIGLRDV